MTDQTWNRKLYELNYNFFQEIPDKINLKEILLIEKAINGRIPVDALIELYWGLTVWKDKGCWTTEDQSVYIRHKGRRAHRISFELFHETINSKLQVCHYCDRKGCINPLHLYQGTQSINMHDYREKVKRFRKITREEWEYIRAKEWFDQYDGDRKRRRTE